MSELTPEIQALKTRLKSTWMAGDFGQIAKAYEEGAAEFISRLQIPKGAKVLDVACGNGNLAIPAARAGAVVTGLDIAPNLLEQGRARAKSEGLKIEFSEGDAEGMPYSDHSFDVVVTMFGVMFCPRPEKAAAELIRVCKTGGRIAMANWTPGGFIGQLFKLNGKYAPPPTGMPSPVLWGEESKVRERLQEGITNLQLCHRMMIFKFPFGPAEVVDQFIRYYGPTQKVYESLDVTRQKDYRHDMIEHWAQHNRSAAQMTEVESEYLEVVAVRS